VHKSPEVANKDTYGALRATYAHPLKGNKIAVLGTVPLLTQDLAAASGALMY